MARNYNSNRRGSRNKNDKSGDGYKSNQATSSSSTSSGFSTPNNVVDNESRNELNNKPNTFRDANINDQDNFRYSSDNQKINRSSGKKNISPSSFRPHTKNVPLLPPPAWLESYEEISPGFSNKLIAIVESEQAHRHFATKSYIKFVNSTTKLGQVLSGILMIFILYVTIMLAKTTGLGIAAFVCICGFLSVTIINVSAAKNNTRNFIDKIDT